MTTTYEPNLVLSTEEYDVVGTRPVRHDGPDKVTGRAQIHRLKKTEDLVGACCKAGYDGK